MRNVVFQKQTCVLRYTFDRIKKMRCSYRTGTQIPDLHPQPRASQSRFLSQGRGQPSPEVLNKEEKAAGGGLEKCLLTQQTAPFGNTKPLGDSAALTAAASRNSVPFTIGESTTGVLAGGGAGVPKAGTFLLGSQAGEGTWGFCSSSSKVPAGSSAGPSSIGAHPA